MIHAFTYENPKGRKVEYLLLDVESGAVHQLDQAAYEIARCLEDNRDPYALGLPEELVADVLEEFESLREMGMFDAPAQPPNEVSEPQVIKSMCLHVAHDCNLRCKYCFAETGEFQGERMLMPFAVGKAALDFLIASAKGRQHLEVDLFGGEPLMNFEVVQQIVAYGRELEKRHGKTIRFTMTTNGLALTPARSEYLNKEMHNIVLSLDGRKEIHDALRPTPSGKGSYDAALKNMQTLVAGRGEKEYYVRGTFTNRNLDFVQDVKALREAGFEQISMEPVVLPEENEFAIRQEHVQSICAQYDALLAYIIKSREDGKWLNFFHFMLDMEHGPCLSKRIKGCGAGLEYIALTPDGDIYPCHQFVGENAFKLGNVMEGSFDASKAAAFLTCNVRTKPACKACWAKYFCSGGCAANAWKYNRDLMQPQSIACALERKRTECAIGLNTL